MSTKKELKTEVRDEMEECLESALQRVVSLEQQKVVPQLDHVLALANQKEHILAAQFFARKELQCPVESDQGTSTDDEKNQLLVAIDNRHSALLNHRMIKNALQSAAFNIQMQEAVRDSLQKMNVDETVDNLKDRGVLLAHCSSNLHTCKELASVVEEKKKLDKEICQLQRQYSAILKEIKPKWEALQDRVMQEPEKNPALLQLQTKTREKEGKLQLLVTMIQGLVSSCRFQWGAFEYFVQLLLLCDSVITQQDTLKQREIMNEITRIHDEEEDKENRGAQRQMLSSSKTAEKHVP